MQDDLTPLRPCLNILYIGNKLVARSTTSNSPNTCGVIWIFSLLDLPYLMGVCIVEDQRTNTIKRHLEKQVDYVLKFY